MVDGQLAQPGPAGRGVELLLLKEREGVLRFEAQCREGKQVKAWDVLCETLGVASATANKAVKSSTNK